MSDSFDPKHTPIDDWFGGERVVNWAGRLLRSVVFLVIATALGALAISESMPFAARIPTFLASLSVIVGAIWPFGPHRRVRGIKVDSVSYAGVLMVFPLLVVTFALEGFGEVAHKGVGAFLGLGFLVVLLSVVGAVLHDGRRAATGPLGLLAESLHLRKSAGLFEGPTARGKTADKDIVVRAAEESLVVEISGFKPDLIVAPQSFIDLRQRTQRENLLTGDPVFDRAVYLWSSDPPSLLAYLDVDAREALLGILRHSVSIRDGVLRWVEPNRSALSPDALGGSLQRAVAIFAPRDAFHSLAEQAEREPLADSRIARLRALTTISPERARGPLERALSDAHGSVRGAAAELILADTGAPEKLRAAATHERLRLASADGSLSIASSTNEAGALSMPVAQGALALALGEKKKN